MKIISKHFVLPSIIVKGTCIMAMILASSLALASNLSGKYEVQTNACNSLLVVGETISIFASATKFSYGIGDLTIGFQPQLEIGIGDFISSGLGSMSDGQQTEDNARYFAEGNNFFYTQTFLKGPSQSVDVITREVQFVKNSDSVSFRDSAIPGPTCVLHAL